MENGLQNFISSPTFLTHKNTARINGEPFIKIPVVVHLIGNDIISQVSVFRVQQQIQILNSDYRKILGTNGFGAGVDTEIQFCLASKDQFGVATNGIVEVPGVYPVYLNTNADNASLKSLSNWPAASYLNIWVCNVDPGLLAWGTFPSMYLGTLNEYQDGVVCGVNYFGLTSDANYGSGRTLTHEVGHWLNLIHTWGDEADCSGDDFVFDTPYCSDKYFSDYSNGCPRPVQCSVENSAALTDIRQTENYMDYSDDLCLNMFTSGQKDRMMGTLFFARSSLAFSLGGCDIPASCEDGYQNGDETGIDCGGSICQPCIVSGGGAGISYCEDHKPDQFIKMNNQISPSITLCPEEHPYVQLGCGGLTDETRGTLIPTEDYAVACSDATNECTWFLQLIGNCDCTRKEFFWYVEVYYNCDEYYNCSSSFGGWFTRDLSDFSHVWDFDISNAFGFTFQPGQRYNIKLASSYNGEWKEGFKQVYINNYNLSLSNTPLSTSTYSAASHITTENLIINSPSVVVMHAGVEISMLPGTNYTAGSDVHAYIDVNQPCFDGRMQNANIEEQPGNPYAIISTYPNYNEAPSKINNTVNSVSSINANSSNKIMLTPNPSSNETTIKYSLLKSTSVKINIFNSLGNIEEMLIDEKQTKGEYEIKLNTVNYKSGIYYIQLETIDSKEYVKLSIMH